MTDLDRATVDHLLSTTRAVRKRLDLTRPVPSELIEECLRLAVQAPTGSNRQGWRWLVVTDATKRAALADLYRRSFGPYLSRSLAADRAIPKGSGRPAGARSLGERPPLASARSGRRSRVADSAIYLADHLHEVPVHVIPCIEDYTKGEAHAGVFGSIYPAVWSLQLALRSRGLGSVLTTLHLVYEAEAAELLGVPDGVLQVGLLPVAYFTGADFKPAKRRPVEELTYWDEWGRARS